MSRLRVLLIAGVAVPILYFSTVIASSFAYPGYSHLTQYASELGMAGTRSAIWFNGGIFVTGLAAIAASAGIYVAARNENGGRLWPVLATVSLALFGVGLLFGALFPMPDPRHGGFGLGMGLHLTPFFLAIALRRAEGRRRLVRYLVITAVVMLGFLAVMMGVGGLVTSANVGLFQRVYALASFSWIGIASYAFLTGRGGRSAPYRM